MNKLNNFIKRINAIAGAGKVVAVVCFVVAVIIIVLGGLGKL